MYKAFCSECGKEFEVPFKPNPNMPIYCRECWEKKKHLKNVRLIEGMPKAITILVVVLVLMFVSGPLLWLFGQVRGDSPTSFAGLVMAGLAMVLLVAFQMAGWRNIFLTLGLVIEGLLSVILTLLIVSSIGLPWWFLKMLTGPSGVIASIWVLIYGIASTISVIPTSTGARSFKKIKSGRKKAIAAVTAVPICTLVAAIVAFEIWTAFIPSFFIWALAFAGLPSADSSGIGLAQWEFGLFLETGPIIFIIFGVGLLICFFAGLISIEIVIEVIEALAGHKGDENAIISSNGLQTQKDSAKAGRQNGQSPSIPSTSESGDQSIAQTDIMCAWCRKHITKSEGRLCPTCHKFFCDDHYPSDNHNCRKRTPPPWEV